MTGKRVRFSISMMFIAALTGCGVEKLDTQTSTSVQDAAEKSSAPLGSEVEALGSETPRPGIQGEESPSGDSAQLPIPGRQTKPSGESLRGNPTKPAPVESQLVDKNGIRAIQLQEQMQTEDFEPLVRKMLRQADADSLDMTRLYRDSLLRSLQKDKRFQLSEMACGSRVCAATFNGNVEDEGAFAELIMNPADGSKMYSAVIHMVPPGPGRTSPQYRIVFSTDPQLNALPGKF